MLREPSEIETARQARRCIGVVRQKLMKPAPEVLEACTPHLRIAIDSLERLQRALLKLPSYSASRGHLKQEIAALRLDLAEVNALLRNAGTFYAGLASLLAPLPDEITGYAPGGPVPIRAAPTVQVEA